MGSSESTEGFRVVSVVPASPADEAKLSSYFDFILSMNGVRLVSVNDCTKIIEKSKNCKVFLYLYNVLLGEHREVVLVPDDTGLGCIVRWDHYETKGLRVLSVAPHSLAEYAGLTPLSDYILGTPEETLNTIDRFALINKKSKNLTLYTYNAETNAVRTLTIKNPLGIPLGLDVGEGLLHSLPAYTPPTPLLAEDVPQLVPVPLPPLPSATHPHSRTVQILPPPSPLQRPQLASSLLFSQYISQ